MSLFYPAPTSTGASSDVTRYDGQDTHEVDVNRPFPKDEITQLARNLTRQSSHHGEPSLHPFSPEAEGTELDPHSEKFNARKWAEAAVRLQSRDDKNPGRTAGVAFSDLSAYGFGSALDFQSNVGNMPLQVYGEIKKLLGAKQDRIDILRNIDGLVRSGEMLVVLGPPGR